MTTNLESPSPRRSIRPINYEGAEVTNTIWLKSEVCLVILPQNEKLQAQEYHRRFDFSFLPSDLFQSEDTGAKAKFFQVHLESLYAR